MRWIIIGVAIIAGVATIGSAMLGGLAPVMADAHNLPVYSVERSEPMVALTFNGAWGPEYGEDILDVLADYGAKATFFVLNVWLEQNPDAAERVVSEGHEIAMHSATHADPVKLNPQQVQAEVRSNCQAIVGTVGVVPDLFRPPAGSYDERTVPAVQELGFEVIQWSVDSIDWTRPRREEIVNRITSKIAPGDIVLFHTNVAETVAALGEIIEFIGEQGWDMVTVSELLLDPPFYVDHTGRQRRLDDG